MRTEVRQAADGRRYLWRLWNRRNHVVAMGLAPTRQAAEQQAEEARARQVQQQANAVLGRLPTWLLDMERE